ncbi:hypothetical protein ACH5RR_038782 [Cinchona calisaya]|uniref:Uncharacterized protein n=1 Tax=Cinchona calisaya TaxID=153742 RepID=A0ABD2XZS1_9GENT
MKNIVIGDQDKSETYFSEWIYNKLEKSEDITNEIKNEDDSLIAKKLMIVGLWCIQWYPVGRPSMKVVIQILEAEEIPTIDSNQKIDVMCRLVDIRKKPFQLSRNPNFIPLDKICPCVCYVQTIRFQSV